MNSPYPLPCTEMDEAELEKRIIELRIAVEIQREVDAMKAKGVRCGNA